MNSSMPVRAMGLASVPSPASPARPKPDRPVCKLSVPALALRPTRLQACLSARLRTVSTTGVIGVDGAIYKIGFAHAFGHVLDVTDLNRHRCPDAEPSPMS